MRSFSLCCDLLNRVCHAAVTYCKDALESHLHVIVGTLIPLVGDQPEIQEQVDFHKMHLLFFFIICRIVFVILLTIYIFIINNSI